MVKKIILITFLLKVGGYVMSLKSSFHLFFTAKIHLMTSYPEISTVKTLIKVTFLL
jgi:hypothetical protein